MRFVKKEIRSRPLSGPNSFSLVELIVVIAIISLLMAMLLPALKSAKESGNGAKCLNNLKQFHAGVILYTLDNDEYLVPWYKNEGIAVTWDQLLLRRKYLLGKQMSSMYGSTNLFRLKLDMKCPSNHNGWQPNENTTGGSCYDGVPNYSYNVYVGTESAAPWVIKRISSITDPARKVMFTESGVYLPLANPYQSHYVIYGTSAFLDPTSFNYMIADAHHGRSNVMFFDGHVESILRGGINPQWVLLP